MKASFSITDKIAPEIDRMPADIELEDDGKGNKDMIETWLNSHGGASAKDTAVLAGVSNEYDANRVATGPPPVTWTYLFCIKTLILMI